MASESAGALRCALINCSGEKNLWGIPKASEQVGEMSGKGTLGCVLGTADCIFPCPIPNPSSIQMDRKREEIGTFLQLLLQHLLNKKTTENP